MGQWTFLTDVLSGTVLQSGILAGGAKAMATEEHEFVLAPEPVCQVWTLNGELFPAKCILPQNVNIRLSA